MTRSPVLAWLCLRAFPASERAEYANDLLAVLDERLEVEATRGRWALLRYQVHAAIDAVGVAWRSRLRRAPATGNKNLPSDPPIWTLDMLLQDLRFGVRTLWHHPLFSLAIIATLALGIGANAMIYSAVDTVVLNPFDMPNLDRVVSVGTEYPRLGRPLQFFEVLSGPEYADILRTTATLSEMAGFDLGNR